MKALNRLTMAVAVATASLAAIPASYAADCELLVWEDIQKSKGITDAVAAFEQETKCKVSIQEMPYVQQIEKLRLDGPAGIGPDVLLIASDQLGASVVQGLIAPLTATPEQLTDYTESALNAFTSDGQLYGLPKVVETLVMYYNKDLLPTPFDTLDEYKKFSQERHAADAGNYGLIAKFDQIYYAYSVIAPYGGYIFARDEKGNFDVTDVGLSNEGAIEAANYLRTFYEDGTFPAGILGENGLNAIDSLFTEKKAAAVINGPWAYEPYTKTGINFGVTPLPKLPNGKDMSSLLGVKGYAVSTWSKDPDLAEKFIQFINKPEWAKKRFEITTEIPASKAVMNDPIITDNEFAKAVAIQSTRAEAMPSIPEMSQVWTPIDSALQLVVSGKQDAPSALKGATEQIHNQIEAFRSGF
ncbi:MAG TPA: extracellular solute-binding protein [Candidatus Anaerobiospirillum stercoravium]|nr:extracellular solute-binding protein [Candidatus Anaerobiospirillum stercoravium]